jgi:hypothetical protein
MSLFASSIVVVLLSAQSDEQAVADRVDGELALVWKEQGVAPAAPADDAVWLRRASLDLRGVVPAIDEVEAYLADRATDRRARWIDSFSADRRFARLQSRLWCTVLFPASGKDAEKMGLFFQRWCEHELAEGRSFGEVTRRLLSDSAATLEPGSTSFALAYRDSIETLAGVTARAFLGLQIQCAQCHDHPTDHWSRAQFERYAALFVEMRGDHGFVGEHGALAVRVTDGSPEWDLEDRLDHLVEVADRSKHRRTDEPMAAAATPTARTPGQNAALEEVRAFCRSSHGRRGPIAELTTDEARYRSLLERLPGDVRELVERYHDRRARFSEAAFLDGSPCADVDGRTRRAALADWVVSPSNPWYARAVVNREWAHFFGKGLVEPVDDLTGGSDRVAPRVLDLLADSFARHGFDLRFLARTLARTRAYAIGNLDAAAPGRDAMERCFTAHPRRSTTLEQHVDALLAVARHDDAATEADVAHEATDVGAETRRALDRLVATIDDDQRTVETCATRAAELTDEVVPARLDERRWGTTRRELFDATLPPVARLRRTWLVLLGRPASEAEARRLVPLLEAEADRRTAFAELRSALVRSTEFHTNE